MHNTLMPGLANNIRQWASAKASALSTKLTQKQFVCILAFLVGLIAGFCAFLLKTMISDVTLFVKGIFPIDQVNWLLLIVPVIGILLCGIYSRYIVHDNMEHGTERIRSALGSGNVRLPRHVAYAPMVAAALTLGFGGSAGSEGPIAYTGAGIGSNLGKFFHLDDQYVRLLVIIGAGAGIAGIFKAPIGGMLFSLEVLGMGMTTVSVIALVCGCLTAASVAYACSGFNIDLAYIPTQVFKPEMIAPVLLLGVACGLYSAYYAYFLQKTENVLDRVRNPWVKNVGSGVLIAVMIFLFPVLYGDGYNVMSQIINGTHIHLLNGSCFFGLHGPWVLALFLLGVLLIKSIATSATNSGGGVGGDFAPTLFAGCFAGMLFAYVSNTWLGTHLDMADFALFGMAGVMAGAVQAPLMAVFLTAEMVGDFSMFLPLTLTSAISFLTLKYIQHHVHIKFRPSWVHNKVEELLRKL